MFVVIVCLFVGLNSLRGVLLVSVWVSCFRFYAGCLRCLLDLVGRSLVFSGGLYVFLFLCLVVLDLPLVFDCRFLPLGFVDLVFGLLFCCV